MGQLSFEERYESIVKEIDKRRAKWTLASVPFEDVRQEILIHVSIKLYQFDESKVTGDKETGFLRWLNRTISNQIRNKVRNKFSKWSRPCLSTAENPRGCPFNTGGDTCSKTSTGLQCGECLAYRKWEKRKLAHFQVQQTLPLENHAQEISNIQADTIDIASKKEVIDRRVMEKLTKYEQKVYRMLFIQGRSERDVGKALKLRKTSRMFAGYSYIHKFKKKVVKLARIVIDEDGLV